MKSTQGYWLAGKQCHDFLLGSRRDCYGSSTGTPGHLEICSGTSCSLSSDLSFCFSSYYRKNLPDSSSLQVLILANQFYLLTFAKACDGHTSVISFESSCIFYGAINFNDESQSSVMLAKNLHPFLLIFLWLCWSRQVICGLCCFFRTS